MGKFEFVKPTIIKNFLTDIAFTILKVIKANSDSFPKELMIIVEENGMEIKKSQFYRYLNSLREYKLIETQGWKRERKFSGYTYKITDDGIHFLRISSELFE